MNADKKYLKQAVKQARLSLEKCGFPAGAVLVLDGKVIAKGLSLGGALNDPTEHSETSCIRKACKKLKTTNLAGATLYASLEPCLMCFSVANWAGISRIVYGSRKNEEMVRKGCYEGGVDLEIVNGQNTRHIEIVYIDDFESENLAMISDWEKSLVK